MMTRLALGRLEVDWEQNNSLRDHSRVTFVPERGGERGQLSLSSCHTPRSWMLEVA